MTLSDTVTTPDSSTPLADSVLSAEMTRLLRSRVTSSGDSGVTVGTAPLDGRRFRRSPSRRSTTWRLPSGWHDGTSRRGPPPTSRLARGCCCASTTSYSPGVPRAGHRSARDGQGARPCGRRTGRRPDHVALLRPHRRPGSHAVAAQGAILLLTSTRVRHEPIGVIGVISPWNYLLTLSISDVLAALMAGNTLVPRRMFRRCTPRCGSSSCSSSRTPEGGAECR